MTFIWMLVGFIVVMTIIAVWLSVSLNETKGKSNVSFSWQRGLKNKKDNDDSF
jgi:hypothetical protein